MPFFIFVLILFLFFFFLKNFRLIFILNILILSIVFAYFIKNSENLRNRYEYTNRDINFNKILKLPQIQKYSDIFIPDLRISNFNEKDQLFHGDYAKLFRSAYFTSSKNNFIGTGHKSFFFECMKLNLKDISCNIHPHNIYLEILVNTGIIGLFVFIIILLLSLHKILKLLFKDSINKTQNIILISFLVYFIAEFVPFRTYGSIFSTFNGTIFWFFFAIISFLNKTKLKKRLI
jgi:O-antigen ligase